MTELKRRGEIMAAHCAHDADLRALWKDVREEFLFSWDAQSLPHPSRFGLFFDGEALIAAYTCPIPAWSTRRDAHGSFVRGLWDFDVAELFIYSTRADAYQEFNIAPSGAWWSCLFSGYREESKAAFSPPVVTVEAVETTSGWNAAIKVPLSSLAFSVDALSDLRLNICLIQGKAPRNYLSAAFIETPAPDFHYFRSYLPLKTGN